MTSRPVTLPDDLSADDAVQVAWLIRRYREKAHIAGASVSPGLLALERAVAREAMQGQLGSTVGRPAEPRNSRHMDPLLLTYGEAAGLLGYSLSTVKRRVASGDLVPVRDGGCARLRRSDIDAFIDQKRTA